VTQSLVMQDNIKHQSISRKLTIYLKNKKMRAVF